MINPTKETYTDFQKYYDLFNHKFFHSELPNCLITYQRGRNFMAYFGPKRFKKNERVTDEIAINPTAFESHDKTQILQTLLHEMCHLWQDHFGTPSRGGYHNKEWGRKMKAVGLLPFGVGSSNYGKETGQQMNDKVIEGGVFDQFIRSDEYEFKMWVEPTKSIRKDQVITTIKEEIQDKLESLLAAANEEITVEVKAYLDKKKYEVADILENVQDEAMQLAKEQGYKIKYQCRCNYNVWGKANLKIMCLECNDYFMYALD